MFEKYMIQTRGFRNIRRGDDVIGFQFRIRTTYYRGVALAIVSGLDVSVDGQAMPAEQLRVSVGGPDYTLDEMTREEGTRWPFGEAAVVSVLKPGGLAPGRHELSVTQSIKPAYMPGKGFVANARKTITLVQ